MSTTCPSRSCRPSNVSVSPSRGLTGRAWPNVSVGPAIAIPCHAYLSPPAGLDASRYRVSTAESEERQFGTLDSLMSDAERYKDAEPFIVRCRGCQGQVTFEPISDREVRSGRATYLFTPFPRSSPLTPPAELAALLGGRDVPRLQDGHAYREPAGAARGADPGADRAVLRGLDGVRRPDVRAAHAHDGRVRAAVPAAGLPGARRVRGASAVSPLTPHIGPVTEPARTTQYSDAQLYTQLRYYGSLFSVEDALKKSSAAKWGAHHPSSLVGY